MPITSRWYFVLLLVGSWVIAGGCGGSGPTSMPAGQVELTGVVKQKGRPLTYKNVYYTLMFEPIDGPPVEAGSLSIQVSEDGSYAFYLAGRRVHRQGRRFQLQTGWASRSRSPAKEGKQLDIDVTAPSK